MNAKVSNAVLAIEALVARRSCLRSKTADFSGSMALCVFISVSWPQAALTGEFKPEPPEPKIPHYSSQEKRVTPLRNGTQQEPTIDFNRENRTVPEALKQITIPETESWKKLADRSWLVSTPRLMHEPSPEEAKRTKEIFDHVCKLNNTLTDNNFPHNAMFGKICHDEEISELKSLCDQFPLDRRCVDLLPSLLIESSDIPAE